MFTEYKQKYLITKRSDGNRWNEFASKRGKKNFVVVVFGFAASVWPHVCMCVFVSLRACVVWHSVCRTFGAVSK